MLIPGDVRTRIIRAMGLDYDTEQKKQAKALGMTLEAYRRRLADSLSPATARPTASANQGA